MFRRVHIERLVNARTRTCVVHEGRHASGPRRVPLGLRPCLVIEHARFLPHCSRIPFALENRLHCAPRHCLLTPPFKADKIYRGMSRTKRYFWRLPLLTPFCPLGLNAPSMCLLNVRRRLPDISRKLNFFIIFSCDLVNYK